MSLDTAALDDLKSRHPVFAVAAERTALRQYRGARGRSGWTHGGPCPLCSSGSGKKTNQQFECNAEKWACAACGKGGDVIELIGQFYGCGFNDAVEKLGGLAEVKDTPVVASRAGRRAFKDGFPRNVPDKFAGDAALATAWRDGFDKARSQDTRAAYEREAERGRLFMMWQRAADWRGSPVETYLALRGLTVPGFIDGANGASPTRAARLRFMADAPYFHGETRDEIGRRSARVIYRGPAMLAAIRDAAGTFRGLHVTWFDLSDLAAPKFKAAIVDPDSGEVLVAKKARGSKQGGFIDLGGCPLDPPEFDGPRAVYFTRQFSGEGIESTLAVHSAMVQAGRSIAGIAWRAGIDLGNLVGSAAGTVRHPTLKDKAGRARNVPGCEPDLSSPAMPVAAGVRELVQLADGDSDPFTTQQAMARGEARRRAQGLAVRTLWPKPGTDFNSMLKPELGGVNG
jgi:hypothetical protein